MRKLNVAIIGQGRSGRNIHGTYLLSDPERFTVVAVVDALAERRARAEREYGCKTYESYQQLFGQAGIDFVVNASFSHQHAPITEDLIEHGFHVLVEKPAAPSAMQFQALIDASEKHGRMLAVFQQSRFAPYFEQVRKVIASGVLGRIVQIDVAFNGFNRRWDWQCCQDRTAGSLFNTGPHPLDQALQLLNYPEGMPGVLCRMDRANTSGDAEDYVKLILTAPGRPLIDLEVSCCDAWPKPTYKVQGTLGGLSGSMSKLSWRYFDPAKAPARNLIRTPLSDENGLPCYCREQLEWAEDSWESLDSNGYAANKLYDTIYDHLTRGVPLVVTPQQVRQQLAVIEECHRQNPLSRMEYPDGQE